MKNSLFIAFGNPDRQDDGAAWKILESLAEKFGVELCPGQETEILHQGARFHFLFLLQLLPEVSELIAKYDQVVFMDAHTENIAEDVRAIEISAVYQRSPFTHHMTAQTCLELARTIYKAEPAALLVSIKGHQFGFDEHLSAQTSAWVPTAVEKIVQWLARN